MSTNIRAHLAPATHPVIWSGAAALAAGWLLLRSPGLLLTAAAIAALVALAVTRPFAALAAYAFVLIALPRLRIVFGIQVIPIYIVDVCLAVALLGLMLRLAQNRWTWRPTPVDSHVAFYLLATVPSFLMLFYRYPQYAMESVYFLARYVLHIAVFFLVTQFVNDERRQVILLRCVLAGLAVSGVWAILQALPALQPVGVPLTDLFNTLTGQRSSLIVSGSVRRAAAGFNTANDFAGCMVLFLPLLLFRRPGTTRRFERACTGLALALSATGIVLSFSRTAIGGLILGLLVASLLVLLRGRVPIRATLAVASLVLIVVLAASFSPAVQDTVQERATAYLNPTENTNVQARLIGHSRFAEAVLSDPLMLLLGQNLRTIDLEHRALLPEGTFRGFVSNSWILVLLDTGIIAFILYSLTYLATVRRVLGVLFVAPLRSGPVPVVYGFLVSLIAVFCTHAFDNYFAIMIIMKGGYFTMLAMGMTQLTPDEVIPRTGSPGGFIGKG